MNGTMTIEMNCTKLISDLDKVDKGIRNEVAMKAVDAGGHQVMNYARINVRNNLNKHPTDALANSIDVKSQNEGSGAVAVVGPHRPYARIHELGGTIVPRKSKYLMFRMDGRFVKVRSVTIPARPYMKPAVEEHKSEIVAAMQAQIDKGLHW